MEGNAMSYSVDPMFQLMDFKNVKETETVFEADFFPRPEYRNPHGDLSGGILAAVCDIAMGRLLEIAVSQSSPFATVDLDVSYFRKLSLSETIRVRAEFQKRGRRVAFIRCQLSSDSAGVAVESTARMLIVQQ